MWVLMRIVIYDIHICYLLPDLPQRTVIHMWWYVRWVDRFTAQIIKVLVGAKLNIFIELID